MDIIKNKEGSTLKVILTGHLDTATSKDLEAALKDELSGIKDLEFDFSKLDYISSAGLRLLLVYSQQLGGKEHVVVEHLNPVVSEIFHVTSFANFVSIR